MSPILMDLRSQISCCCHAGSRGEGPWPGADTPLPALAMGTRSLIRGALFSRAGAEIEVGSTPSVTQHPGGAAAMAMPRTGRGRGVSPRK